MHLRKFLSAPLLLALAFVAGCERAPFGADIEARRALAPARDPILFVHGWHGSASGWNTMITRFKADGWSAAELYAWSYNSDQSNATIASQLSAKVNEILTTTGAARVDVVTHSMGGLSSRYFAKNLGGDTRIDAWVSLGGPNHGTQWAYGCFSASCVEMRPNSTFLKALNATDETPGAVRYGTWWSPCDEVINPDSSVPLSGATNTQTACISHSGFFSDLPTYTQVRDFVSR